MKQTILKITAWITFGVSTLVALGILSTVFFLSTWIQGANLMKLATIDLVIILIAMVVFMLGLGLLEFMLSFLKIEEEVEEIEEEIGKGERH